MPVGARRGRRGRSYASRRVSSVYGGSSAIYDQPDGPVDSPGTPGFPNAKLSAAAFEPAG